MNHAEQRDILHFALQAVNQFKFLEGCQSIAFGKTWSFTLNKSLRKNKNEPLNLSLTVVNVSKISGGFSSF